MINYKVSVIIPTFKPRDYLFECLDSIIHQTLKKIDFEVIIVLNGCDDPWSQNIQRYIKYHMEDINVRFFQTDVVGVSNARNIGLDNAVGDYVTFIDDDDYISPCYLENLLQHSTPDTVVLSNTIAFNDETHNKKVRYDLSNVYKQFYDSKRITLMSRVRKYFSGPCMKLFPMNFIGNRRFDVRFVNGEDSLFMFMISDKIKSITFASKDAVYYRRFRANSAVTTYRSAYSRCKNSLSLINNYSKIYFNSPSRYNLLFYLTRVLGAIRSMF